MIKRHFFGVVVLFVILFIAGQAVAEQCPDITGDWGGSFDAVFYTPDSGYSFGTIEGILHITDQKGCLFYGTLASTGAVEVDCPLVGSIDTRKISMSSCGAVLRGKLWGNNKIALTVEDIALDDSDMQSSGKGIVVKLNN